MSEIQFFLAGAFLLVVALLLFFAVVFHRTLQVLRENADSQQRAVEATRRHYEKALHSAHEKLMAQSLGEYSVNKTMEPKPRVGVLPDAVKRTTAEEAMRVADATGIPLANAYQNEVQGQEAPAQIVGGRDLEG